MASKLMLSVAAAGMIFAPVAAQANTRAGDSGAVYAAPANPAPGMARGTSGEQLGGDSEGALIILLLAGAAFAAAIAILLSNKSNGAN